MKDRIRQEMCQAAKEYGCWYAAVALCVLGKVFGVFVDEMTLHSGIGIMIPKKDNGTDEMEETAYAGAGQFLAVAARLKGLDREETLALCGKWKQCFLDWRLQRLNMGEIAEKECDASGAASNVENPFLAVLMLAYDFIDQRREFLGLGDKVSKPQKYYDSIYEDSLLCGKYKNPVILCGTPIMPSRRLPIYMDFPARAIILPHLKKLWT